MIKPLLNVHPCVISVKSSHCICAQLVWFNGALLGPAYPIFRLQSDVLQAIPDLNEVVFASSVHSGRDQKQRKTWQDPVGLTPCTYTIV